MNILITGDMGFVGTHLKRALAGHSVSGFDIRRNATEDIRNLYHLELAFENGNVDMVIHLAALAGVRRSRLFPQDYISTNIEGIWNVARLCEKYGVGKLIFFSATTVFGNAVPPVKETAPKAPISLYGITKLAGENIVQNCSVPTAIIRPFCIYGPGGRKDLVINKWLAQHKAGKPLTVFGDDQSCRGYIHINDLSASVVALIDNEWPWKNQDFNLGGPCPVRLRDVMDVFIEAFPGVEFEYLDRQAEDVTAQYADTAKAREMIGFNPTAVFRNKCMEIINEHPLEA
jgi:UDP-glucuronate 4-epimerase